jgi:CcmD family protein
MYLIKGDLKWDRLAYCSAELGILFTITTLISGIIWSHPAWGTWWEFDARPLWNSCWDCSFVGYHMLRAYLPERESRARLSTVFGFLAAIDVPINYFATYIWEQHHPGSSDPEAAGSIPIWASRYLCRWSLPVLFTRICWPSVLKSQRWKKKSNTLNRWCRHDAFDRRCTEKHSRGYSVIFGGIFIFVWLMFGRQRRLEKKLDQIREDIRDAKQEESRR